MTENDEDLKRLIGEQRFQILIRPSEPKPTTLRPLTKAQMIPDKSYDKLTARLPYELRVRFERVCDKKQLRPSEMMRMLIEEFVNKNSAEKM